MLTKSIGKINFFVIPLVFLTVQTILMSKGLGQEPVAPELWFESGLPYIYNYSPKEYGGFIQNWSVIQDRRGIIYVANNDGLLEYDGVNWRRYEDNGKLRSILSLAIDSAGVIYVGTAEDFGYVMPDSLLTVFASENSALGLPISFIFDGNKSVALLLSTIALMKLLDKSFTKSLAFESADIMSTKSPNAF